MQVDFKFPVSCVDQVYETVYLCAFNGLPVISGLLIYIWHVMRGCEWSDLGVLLISLTVCCHV